MTVHFYFNRYVKKHETVGAQLHDCVIRAKVGAPELRVDELQLNEIDLPTSESENVVSIPRVLKRREQKLLEGT